MKNRLKGAVGVALTLVLLLSLTVGTALPASALSQPAVTVDPNTASAAAEYAITFTTTEAVPMNITETFPNVTTGAYATTADVILTYALLDGAVANVTSITSSLDETPTADSYVAATRTLTVGGLTAGASRTLTVTYRALGAISITFPGDTGLTSLKDNLSIPVATEITIEGNITYENVAYSAIHPNAADVLVSDQVVTIGIPAGYTLQASTVTVTFSKKCGIVNPSVARTTYTVKVSTTAETTPVTSGKYTIVAPEYPVTMVTLCDSSGTPLKYYPSPTATDINIAIGDALKGDILLFDPGDYTIDSAVLVNKGITLKSAEGSGVTTLIVDSSLTFTIAAGEAATLEGFTLEGKGPTLLATSGAVSVKDCLFDTDDALVAIEADGGLKATGNEFFLADTGDEGIVASAALVGADISGNTFSGKGAVAIDATVDLAKASTISGNDISGITTGIKLTVTDADNVGKALTVSANDISEGTIEVVDLGAGAKVVIINNSLKDSAVSVATDVDTTNLAIMWNDLLAKEDKDALTSDATESVNARFNWWGTDVKSEIEDLIGGTGTVDFEPFLADSFSTVASGSLVATGTTSLDAKDEAGVKVSATGVTVGVISAAKYKENPADVAPKYSALDYYDVYVAGTGVTSATLKLYTSGVTENTEAYVWSEVDNNWVSCSEQKASVYGGYVRVTISADSMPTIDELAGTPFVLVEGPPAALAATILRAPEAGGTDIPLKPTFQWDAVTGATGYEFELSTSSGTTAGGYFVDALVAQTGPNALGNTVYLCEKELDYETTYCWHVKAVSATKESAWVNGVFTTAAAPPPPPPPPTPEPTTPAYIWVIIGIGAALVIAVITLIVRTRRVV